MWPPLSRPLLLVERRHLQSAEHPQRFGLTRTRTDWQPGRGAWRTVEQVLVLRGLPAAQFTACLTHELGHVWLHLEGIDGLAGWEEEGVCEYLAYRYLTLQDTVQSRACAEHIVQNPDPVYGEGVRRVRALVEQVGFPDVVRALQVTHRLPWPGRSPTAGPLRQPHHLLFSSPDETSQASRRLWETWATPGTVPGSPRAHVADYREPGRA